jgi:hypothetical protein
MMFGCERCQIIKWLHIFYYQIDIYMLTFKCAPYLVIFQIAMYTHNEKILLLGHTHELKNNFTINFFKFTSVSKLMLHN